MVILGLGSNIGDRLGYLEQAITFLGLFVKDIVCSSIYQSPAMLLPDAPKDWDNDFLNMAIKGNTSLSPDALLKAIKKVEQQIGRQDRGKWSPREIDIDILAYDNQSYHNAHVTIPHQGLTQRDFAIIPLAEIAPDWQYPAQGPLQGHSAQAIASKFKPLSLYHHKIQAYA